MNVAKQTRRVVGTFIGKHGRPRARNRSFALRGLTRKHRLPAKIKQTLARIDIRRDAVLAYARQCIA